MIVQERKEIDAKEWDALVSSSNGSVFSLSSYLDSTADNWCILWNDDRSGGIACPYSTKLGVKVLYAPFFHRYIEWIGDNEPAQKDLVRTLKHYFKVADAHLHSGKKFLFKKLRHQLLRKENLKKNQQAKRMLKKAQRYEIEERMDRDRLLKLVETELSDRISGIHAHSMNRLTALVNKFDFPDLVQLNLVENGTWQGGIWLLPFNDRIVYLKGTVSVEAKENGGMYRLMEKAIDMAFENDAIFDFGGSNAAGVSRFNKNWGAEDATYYHLRWNNAPLLWKMLKSMRSAWKRK